MSSADRVWPSGTGLISRTDTAGAESPFSSGEHAARQSADESATRGERKRLLNLPREDGRSVSRMSPV